MKYIDDQTFPVTIDGDGGDSAQRIGFVMQAEGILNTSFNEDLLLQPYKYYLMKLQVGPGVYTRHPKQWNDPKDFSRDQQVALIRGCAYWPSLEQYLKDMEHAQMLRMGFAQNGDPYFGTDFIRALRVRFMYPLLWITDIGLIINSIARCGLLPRWKHEIKWFVWMDQDDVGDDINHIGALALAYTHMPTPLSWLARKIFIHLKPKNFGCYVMANYDEIKITANTPVCHPIIGSLRWYFRVGAGSNPRIGQLWERAIYKMGWVKNDEPI